MKKLFFILLLFSISFCTLNVTLSDLGTDAKNKTSGELISGDLEIFIYDDATGGSLIWWALFSNAIQNGSWNVMLTNVPLEYGKKYWKDYEINGDNLNFSSDDRLEFYSPLGDVNSSDLSPGINLSSAIGYLYSNLIGTPSESDPIWTSASGTVARIGTCSAGKVVQNTTTSGVECIDASLGAETDPYWAANSSTVARTGSCTGSNWVKTTTTSGVTCTQPSTSEVSEGTNLYYTDVRTRLALSNSAPITYNSETGAIGISQSTTSTDGYLSSTNWNTFNGKGGVGTCTSGNVVQNVTTSGVECISGGGVETDPVWVAASSTVARTGTCATGKVVQNTTTSGVECISPPAGDEVDPIWTADKEDYNTTLELNTLYAKLSGIDASNITTGTIPDNRISSSSTWNGKAATGTCSANQWMTSLSSSAVTCFQPTTANVTEGTNLYYTDVRARAALSNSAPITYNSETGAIGISQSTTSTDGYLSSTNWNTFNNKAATGICTDNQWSVATTTSGLTCFQPTTANVTEGTNLYYTDVRARSALSNTAPITYNSGTGAIGITQSTTSTDGYLSSTNWNTFNGKATTGTCSANQWATAISSSAFTCAQPSTTNITEGTNLYYTNARAISAIGLASISSNFSSTITGGILINSSTTKPSCTSALRGGLWIDQGSAGVADLFWACMKNSSDSYNWVQVAIG